MSVLLSSLLGCGFFIVLGYKLVGVLTHAHGDPIDPTRFPRQGVGRRALRPDGRKTEHQIRGAGFGINGVDGVVFTFSLTVFIIIRRTDYGKTGKAVAVRKAFRHDHGIPRDPLDLRQRREIGIFPRFGHGTGRGCAPGAGYGVGGSAEREDQHRGKGKRQQTFSVHVYDPFRGSAQLSRGKDRRFTDMAAVQQVQRLRKRFPVHTGTPSFNSCFFSFSLMRQR